MAFSLNIRQVKFYLWLGLAYATVWFLGNLSAFPGTFLQAVGNNLWRVIYVLPINFIFFEFTVPFVLRKRRYIVYNIPLGLFALWVHCMLWSYGLYAWRLLGMQLHAYAGLTTFKSLDSALSAQMAYSVGS